MPAKHLAILLFLIQAIFSCSAAAVCEQLKLTASDANADDRFGVSVAIDGDIAIVGAYRSDSNGSDSGAAYVFEFSGTGWFEQKKLIPSDGDAGDNFGRSVAVEGNTIVVGSHLDDNPGTDSGSAYVFSCSGGVWYQQQKLIASDAAAGDKFGFSVSISNDTIVVGAYGDNNEAGSAYVFTNIGSTWTQQQKLTASDASSDDLFGYSVAVDNNTIIVGAYQDDHSGRYDAGSAYVFTFDGLSWTQDTVIRPSDPNNSDYFGCSIGIDGNCAVIGAYECDVDGVPNAGAAYVFEKTGTGWIQQQKLINDEPGPGDDFGRSVAIEGDTILVGCPYYFLDDEPTGAVFEFIRSGSFWIQQNLLTADNANSDDNFGFSASLSGRRLITGAHFSDDNGLSSGSAYIFTRPAGDLDRDCAVDFTDFGVFALCWRTAQGQTGYDPACDISIPPDVLINILDLNTLCDDWLTGK